MSRAAIVNQYLDLGIEITFDVEHVPDCGERLMDINGRPAVRSP